MKNLWTPATIDKAPKQKQKWKKEEMWKVKRACTLWLQSEHVDSAIKPYP